MQSALQRIPSFTPEEPFSYGNAVGEKEYRIITRVKNNLLMGAIERAGYSSLSNFAEKSQISLSMLCAIINFKVSPLDKNGDWRSIVHTICTTLNKMPSQLFTEAQTKITDAKAKVSEVSEAERFGRSSIPMKTIRTAFSRTKSCTRRWIMCWIHCPPDKEKCCDCAMAWMERK